MDDLVNSAIFSPDEEVKVKSRLQIRKMAKSAGVHLSSIHPLYMAFGKKLVSGFTVPAINIRTLTYDTAGIIFKLMIKKQIGPVIFEIARSEMSYTDQQPDEYAVAILAAAVNSGYRGPVFLQGDHYQFKAKIYQENPQTEIDKIKALIKKSIDAGFFNIDIDASTLVDLSQSALDEQQENNFQETASMTEYIRSIEPKNITVSVGGEIGHIGGKNSTPEEFEAFMEGFLKKIRNPKSVIGNKKLVGISKVSVQTGTSHGGIPLPDGTVAKVSLDFNVLKSIGQLAVNKYHIGGPVQHGASTLPNELFDRFPQIKTLEIHLATGFQNIVYDNLPASLRRQIYLWIQKNCKKERKPDQSEEQFIYKNRKKAFGPFKEKLWHMTKKEKEIVLKKLSEQFEYLFSRLNVFDTRPIVEKYITH